MSRVYNSTKVQNYNSAIVQNSKVQKSFTTSFLVLFIEEFEGGMVLRSLRVAWF
jgi:hypothetical protein